MLKLNKSESPMPKPKTLPERIADFRAELDVFLDKKAAELGEDTPGVPVSVLRNLLTNRNFGCQCQAVQNLEQSE
ncbi:hypothetical protein ACVWZ4_006125 [Bradyrhizobium sp. USDA 4472]